MGKRSSGKGRAVGTVPNAPLSTAASILDWATLLVLGGATLALMVTTGHKGERSQTLGVSAPASRSAPAALAKEEKGRGREATTPSQIPPRGWADIVRRTWKEFKDDHVALVAAGITFYALLAFFPGLAAFVSLYGLFAGVNDARHNLDSLAVVLPPDIVKFIGDEMLRVAGARHAGLSTAFIGGLALAIWSANGAAKACFLGLNIAYEEEETRGFVRLTATSLAFTVGALVFVVLTLAAVISAPAAAALAGPQAEMLVGLARWPLLAAALAAGVTLLYRYGPSRDPAKWRWVSWGAVAATLLWIAASVAFSLYVARFAHYDRTYGSLGAVIAFMMWTYLSSVILLGGAELNAELEHQTARDTTKGAEVPMGARGARMADTIGAAQSSA
ncbi:YihY/virulence factor BrkB family protein [soil metagenome]